MLQLHRRHPDFWDTLSVPAEIKPAHLFTWLEETAPLPEEHDFVLSTDGSGCINGWGASASIIQKVEQGGVVGRVLGEYRPIISGTYGSTVQRREFSAFLDGLHEILRIAVADRPDYDDGDELVPNVQRITGDNRVTVLWYTDRSNLAKSLLFNERNEVLNRRTSEMDLWMRYSFFAKHFCITPMWTERNLIPAQSACDQLCSLAREAMKSTQVSISDILKHNYPQSPDQWKTPRPQKALF